jgi:sugar/nucleoside kinase (ribokinase family)
MSSTTAKRPPQEKAKRAEAVDDDESRVILVIGSIGLDKLLGVEKYPDSDAKVRTTWYKEEGGGDAANTAAAIGKLCGAKLFRDNKMCVKLLGKVGRDDMGDELLQELKDSNVDVSSPLLLRGPEGSTTSFTTIIVSEAEHTRTCLHTPGTCGELILEDVQAVKSSGQMNDVFNNVIHFHSDSRSTDASLALAREAKERGIPVSIDCEKDRNTVALDELLETCDMLFTNSGCLKSYIQRLTSEKEQEHGRSPVPLPTAKTSFECQASLLKQSTIDTVAASLTPGAYFARWGIPMKSNVIVTQGSKGALDLRKSEVSSEKHDDPTEPKNIVSIGEGNGALNHPLNLFCDGEYETSYLQEMFSTGVLRDANVVDTTGCGDTFVGGFILCFHALLDGTIHLRSISRFQFPVVFASFVAGKKAERSGARTAQLSGDDIDSILGSDFESAAKSLLKLMKCFDE